MGSYIESRRRSNGEYDRHKRFERPIEGEVLYGTRMDPTYRHGGGDTNPTCTPSRSIDTSYSFHSPNVPLDVWPDVYPSMSLSRSSRRKIQILKCEDFGYKAKEECKPIGVLPTLSPDLGPMEYKGLSTDTFHMTCKVEAKTCLVMIHGGSSVNMVSERLVAKLFLRVVEHSNPYELQWLREVGTWMVRTQVMVPLRVGDIECDVPMSICHVLLGKPWECDNKAIKNDTTKEYTCLLGKKKARLRPLLPHEIDKAYENLTKERERDKRLESASEPKK